MERSRGKLLAITILTFTSFTLSSALLAGKPERDKQAELEPLVKTTETNVKQNCGCAVAIKVNWASYDNVSNMYRIRNNLDAFDAVAKNQCNSAANKKAFCDNMKTLEVSYAAEVKNPEYSNGVMKITNNSTQYTGEHQMKKHTDKF